MSHCSMKKHTNRQWCQLDSKPPRILVDQDGVVPNNGSERLVESAESMSIRPSEFGGVHLNDEAYPPQAVVQSSAWRLDIASCTGLWQIFPHGHLNLVVNGIPLPADDVYNILSHWVMQRQDFAAIQHTYGLRTKLYAAMFDHAIRHPQILDPQAWNSLGVWHTGGQIALRLGTGHEPEEMATWQSYTLHSWIRTEDYDRVVCHVGSMRSRLRLELSFSQLRELCLIFLTPDGNLWPPQFPMLDLTLVTTKTSNGVSFHAAIESLRTVL